MRKDESTEHRRFTDAFEAATLVIGADGVIRGEVVGNASVTFAGRLEGDLTAAGLIRIESTARIVGNLTSAAIVVSGRVDGDIVASGKVELRDGSVVSGSITAGSVAIANGALYDGSVSMKGAPVAPRDVSFSERRLQAGTSESIEDDDTESNLQGDD